jgi:hypothetical protein
MCDPLKLQVTSSFEKQAKLGISREGWIPQMVVK